MNVGKYLIEFIGTFFLCFTIGMTVIEPGAAGNLAPFAIVAALIVMIYAGGHISGAHYNPAVTLAVTVRGKSTIADFVPYVVAQIAAAFVASSLVLALKSGPTIVPLSLDPGKAITAEALFTFALAFVVLNVATAKATAGNSYYGLAIGLTVLAGAYAVGGVSGGAFNPAVSVALVNAGLLKASDLWIHLAGQLSGAALAALVFRFTVKDHS
jgi:aquaporin Z